jgi:hypothetical protein
MSRRLPAGAIGLCYIRGERGSIALLCSKFAPGEIKAAQLQSRAAEGRFRLRVSRSLQLVCGGSDGRCATLQPLHRGCAAPTTRAGGPAQSCRRRGEEWRADASESCRQAAGRCRARRRLPALPKLAADGPTTWTGRQSPRQPLSPASAVVSVRRIGRYIRRPSL